MTEIVDAINEGQKIRTREGRPVRDLHVLSEPIANGETIIGVVDNHLLEWYADGSYVRGKMREEDLVVAPPRIQGWLNLYPRSHRVSAEWFVWKHAADEAAKPGRIACIPVDCETGEGL